MAKTTKAKRNTNHSKKVKAARARRVQAKRAGVARGRDRWNTYRKAHVLPQLAAKIKGAIAKLNELGGELPRSILVPTEGGQAFEVNPRPSEETLGALEDRINRVVAERIQKATDSLKAEFGVDLVDIAGLQGEALMVTLEAKLATLRQEEKAKLDAQEKAATEAAPAVEAPSANTTSTPAPKTE